MLRALFAKQAISVHNTADPGTDAYFLSAHFWQRIRQKLSKITTDTFVSSHIYDGVTGKKLLTYQSKTRLDSFINIMYDTSLILKKK